MLSLIHTLRGPKDRIKNPATLVIAPMSIISQWKCEADSSSHTGSLKTQIYYGAGKSLDLPSLCSSPSAPDVIITSYGVLLSEWTAGKSPTGLFGTEWWRVVLDEAHFIKNRLSKTARAAYDLKAGRRWVLTGTPIVNKLEDLFSLVHFLGVEPWGLYSYWRTFITIPFENKEVLRALDVVQTILEPLVLRRTKDMKDSDGTSPEFPFNTVFLCSWFGLVLRRGRKSDCFVTGKDYHERVLGNVCRRTRGTAIPPPPSVSFSFSLSLSSFFGFLIDWLDLQIHLHPRKKNLHPRRSKRHNHEKLHYNSLHATTPSPILLPPIPCQTP